MKRYYVFIIHVSVKSSAGSILLTLKCRRGMTLWGHEFLKKPELSSRLFKKIKFVKIRYYLIRTIFLVVTKFCPDPSALIL